MPNNQSSSLHAGNKVASCNDLVTDILSRLPVRTVLQFKSVSKHWYSLITSISFKRLKPDPPSGLFVSVDHFLGYEFVPFDIDNPVKVELLFKPLQNVTIRHSCNGLVLCSCASSNFITMNYYVYNPTTNRFTMLPKPEYVGTGFNMTLAFDPSKSPHYRILYVHSHLVGEYNCQIDIYASETQTFTRSYKSSFDQLYDVDFESCVYWNNTLHWLNRSGFVSYFNLDQEGGISNIKTPFGSLGLRNYSRYIFESRDHLLLVEINRLHTSKFEVHELKRDYSEWSVRYHVDLDQLGRSFPEIMNPDSQFIFRFAVLSLVLGEKEDDSFLVLEIPKKAVRFNLVSKTFHKLHSFTCSRPLDYNCVVNKWLQWPNVYQFMESLYCV